MKTTNLEVAIRRAALAATGLSQKKFADFAKVAPPTVNTFMQGEKTSKRTERKIIAAFNQLGWEIGRRGIWRIENARPWSDQALSAITRASEAH